MPQAVRILLSVSAVVAVVMLALVQDTLQARAGTRATSFKLANGLELVVIPDHRAPVVTHMVWYRVGAADEPAGISGIAHFLEHLMFKSTEKIPSGEFSKIISRLGGQDNAFTSQDATAYFQRIAKERLSDVMEMEADRMVNLRLAEKEVLTERDVIMEERRSRVENNPQAILDEQMNATLYYSHPYGIPVIGWEHEMAKLSRENALSFYKQHYGPNNAIVVVTGDVTPEEAKKLAEQTYGKVPSSPQIVGRNRPMDPEQRSARRVELKDARAGKPSIQRYYLTPSYQTAKPLEAESLDLLMKIVGSGATSRLYQQLVAKDGVASSAGGWYGGTSMDFGKIAVYAVPAEGQSLEKLEAGIDAVLADVIEKGVTEAELDRAKKSYLAEYVYESDSQSTVARRYGWGLVVGRTLEEIDAWPEQIAKVTTADIKNVAERYLQAQRSVTGTLLPTAPDGVAKKIEQPAPMSRS
jgi:zinc protease